MSRLEGFTKLEEQQEELRWLVSRCTEMDLRYVVRMLKHDLRIFAGPKHVLSALDPHAYEAFQASNDLADVVKRVASQNAVTASTGFKVAPL